jgi:threonyl-tRNA synthetase
MQVLHLRTQHSSVQPTKSASDSNFCPADSEAVANLARSHSEVGMPYGLPPLPPADVAILDAWVSRGAPGPSPESVAGRRVIPSALQLQVRAWESFFNGRTPREKLVARYLYEHLFLAHLHFAGNVTSQRPAFFRLVRSRTPCDSGIDEIVARRPNDDPGTSFQYCLSRIDQTIVSKTHIPHELSPGKLAHIRQLFLEPKWEVTAFFCLPRPRGFHTGEHAMDDLDHRNLGTRLDLWHIQEDAPGMVFWHPRGYALYRILEDYIRGKMRRLGYAEVKTPQRLPQDLWVQSGHWEKFGANMFSVAGDERPMALKPMSCPCHVQIFNKGLRSWRELPFRYAEFGACHRNEPSGSLHGLMRTRGFEQDDAHVFCREEDVAGEVARFVTLLREVYDELGFSEPAVALSTRPLIRAGADALWDWAEETLGNAARICGLMFDLQPGEGALYGPKLDFALQNRLGRSWQCGTVQLDSVLPSRLDASYVRPDGSRAVPVMIDHAVFGGIGRFIAILLEHYEGALPFWLSPDQVAVAPLSQDHAAYAAEVRETLTARDIRAVLFSGAETLSRRIVAAHEASIPVVAVVGRRESEQRTVSLRERAGNSTTLTLEDAAASLSRRQRPLASKLKHSDASNHPGNNKSK